MDELSSYLLEYMDAIGHGTRYIPVLHCILYLERCPDCVRTHNIRSNKPNGYPCSILMNSTYFCLTRTFLFLYLVFWLLSLSFELNSVSQ